MSGRLGVGAIELGGLGRYERSRRAAAAVGQKEGLFVTRPLQFLRFGETPLLFTYFKIE
jgi:hypothetical protein